MLKFCIFRSVYLHSVSSVSWSAAYFVMAKGSIQQDCKIFFLPEYYCDSIHPYGPFHGIHMGCSMKSKLDMPAFHMQSNGIHMEWCWKPYEIDHSMIIPHGFHGFQGKDLISMPKSDSVLLWAHFT